MKRPAQLTPLELGEYRARQLTLDHARNTFALVEEAYRAWLRELGRKYKVGTRFTIGVEDGTLTPMLDDRTNGHIPPGG